MVMHREILTKCAVLLTAVVLFFFVLMGCAVGEDGSASGSALSTRPGASMTLVGVAMADSAGSQDGELLRTHLEEAGYTVELAYAGGDSQVQANQIAAMVEDGASALVVQAVDGPEAESALASVDLSGVSVLSYGIQLSSKGTDYYVGCNWEEVGRLQAEHLISTLDLGHQTGTVSVALLTQKDAGSSRAFAGAMAVLQPYVDEGKLLLPEGRTTSEDCAAEDIPTYLTQLLPQLPGGELAGLLCLGVGQVPEAVQTLKTNYKGGAFPVVTGVGYEEDCADLLAQGFLSMTVLNDESGSVQQLLDLLNSILSGSSGERERYLESYAVTVRNCGQLQLTEGRWTLPRS